MNVSVSRVIACPRDHVATYAADMGNAPDWYANISSVEWQGTPGTRVGAQAAFVAHFLGKRLAYTYEIKEFVQGERLVMATAQGPFPMTTIYEWVDADGGTRMTMTNRGNPTGFQAIAAPVMSAAMRRAMTRDLEALAARMEA